MMNDASIHRQTWDQIPWVVNGSISEAERAAVEAHLESCADCREELEFQRRLAISMASSNSPDIDPQASWQQLRARIDAAGRPSGRAVARSEKAARHVLRHARRPSGPWVPWLVAAMVVQSIGLGVMGTALWSHPSALIGSSTGVYRTLSTSEPASGAATIRVVFASDMTVAKMQTLLAASELQVRSGPSSAGVWSLEPARESNRTATAFALRQLRASAEVRFAESIGGSP
jgi:Putative zinc-finger